MKAISLHQPWASFVALGVKTIETRDWRPEHRGPLAIHAAKTTKKLHLAGPLLTTARREDLMGRIPDPHGEWPLGAIVAVVELDDAFKVAARGDERNLIIGAAGRDCNVWTTDGRALDIAHPDLVLGDLSEGRCGWVLRNIRALKRPVPCRGYQFMFDLPPEVEAEVLADLACGGALEALETMRSAVKRSGLELPGLFR